MSIQFPFFADIIKDGKASYYCAVTKYDVNNKKFTIRILSSRHIDDIVYLPIAHPDSVTTSFLDVLISKCREDERDKANSIIVEHIVHEQRVSNDIKKVRTLIVYEQSGREQQKLLLSYLRGFAKNDEEYSIFIISNYGYEPSSESSKRQGSGASQSIRDVKVVEIWRKIRRDAGKDSKLQLPDMDRSEESIEIEIRQSDRIHVMLSKVRTWPLTLQMPLRMKFSKSKHNSIICSIKTNVIEGLLGSMIFVDIDKSRYQIQAIVPTPLLSAAFKHGLRDVMFHVIPSASRIDSSAIVIRLDLTELFNDLYHYLICKLCNVSNMQLEHGKLFRARYIIEDYCYDFDKGEKQQCNSNIYLDDEALLKALVNNFVTIAPRTYLFSQYLKRADIDINELSRWIRLSHRIRKIDIGIPINITGIENVIPINVENIYFAYEVVADRVQYLRKFLQLYKQLKDTLKIDDNIELLLMAFSEYIGERVERYLREKGLHDIAEKRPIVGININTIATRIAILLLELGLHGLSHLLFKYLHTTVKIRGERLRELIILGIGEKIAEAAMIKGRYYMDVAINGFMYRLTLSNDRVVGIVMISDTKPYTSSFWENIVDNFNADKFISFAYEVLGVPEDRCLSTWKGLKSRLSQYVGLYDRKGLIRRAVDVLSNTYGLGNPDDGNITTPMLDTRPIIGKDVITNLTQQLQESESVIRSALKPYMEALYIISMPFCFDGCYNCVLLDKGCGSSPLMKEWSSSKSMAKLMLRELEKQLQMGSKV
jgi:hypothetical protein